MKYSLKFFIVAIVFLKSNNLYSQPPGNFIEADSIMRLYSKDIREQSDKLVGKPFPDFSGLSLSNNFYNNAFFLRHVTLVIYWFTACPPCQSAFPFYNKMHVYSELNKNLQFISISKEDELQASKTALLENFEFPIIASTKEGNEIPFLEMGYPLYVIVDQKGNIQYVKSGGHTDLSKIKSFYEDVIIPKMTSLVCVVKSEE